MGILTLPYAPPQEGQGGSQETLDLHLPPPDVFKNALHLGTFSAVLVTYAASALLHVSRVQRDKGGSWGGWQDLQNHLIAPHPRASAST